MPRFLFPILACAAWFAGPACWSGQAPGAPERVGPRPDEPVPRTDENSRVAHRELLEKARTGRIDLYFLGDSITRRWGASDPQYRPFLEHWTTNFFGWNAGNFGWGSDTLQNILWRVQNGELDGVHPKVVVLMAGANNIRSQPLPAGELEGAAAAIARGVAAILEVVRLKAPGAKVLLMGMTPRNDLGTTDVMPLVRLANRHLARLADGRAIRFVDLDEKMADRDGRLLEGMAVDGLHLSVRGYQVWADALRPHLLEWLGPPARIDLAPPPTGDPSQRRVREKASTNPILPGADPHVVAVGETIWLYPTWNDGRNGEAFFAFSSRDQVTWERHGPLLRLADVPWVKEDGAPWHGAWAPGILSHAGRWYFYYSVGPQHPTPSRLGVAVGESPGGPFRDSGRPLLTGGNGFEAIDPMAFEDPRTGKAYLYAGGSAGATLRVFELDSARTGFEREIPVRTPPRFTEGAFMHERNGRYYLSYSHGRWNHSSYSVHYATSDSPTGPWTYRGAILTGDATRKGPGHHAFLRAPKSGEWLIFYHRWENPSGDGPYRGSRQICVDRVEYDDEGGIRPVVMTGGAGGAGRSVP